MSIIEELNKINDFCLNGRYTIALVEINKTLKRVPNYPLALSYKASILSNMNKYDQALEIINQVIAIDSTNPKYLADKAEIILKQNPKLTTEMKSEVNEYLDQSYNYSNNNDFDSFRRLIPLFLKIGDDYHAKQCESSINNVGRKNDNNIERGFTKSPSSITISLNDPIQKEIFEIVHEYLPRLINNENWEYRLKSTIMDLYRGEKDAQYTMILNFLGLKLIERLINDIKNDRPEKVIKQDFKNKLGKQGFDQKIVAMAIDFWIKTVNNLETR